MVQCIYRDHVESLKKFRAFPEFDADGIKKISLKSYESMCKNSTEVIISEFLSISGIDALGYDLKNRRIDKGSNITYFQ